MSDKRKDEQVRPAATESPPRPGPALVPVETHLSLDIVAELVEGRIRQRRSKDRRWVVGIAVALLGVVVAAYTLISGDLRSTEQQVEGRLLEQNRGFGDREIKYFAEATPIGIGTREIELVALERAQFQLDVGRDGPYNLEARAGDSGLDPVLYLYRWTFGAAVVEAIEYSDDFEPASLDSRIFADLNTDAVYFLEVEDFSGRSGTVELAFRRVIS